MLTEIEPQQMQHLEYLIKQSLNGHHFLFEKIDLANILKSKPSKNIDFHSAETSREAHVLLCDLLGKTTIEEKNDFLGGLDSRQFEILVRTYFQVIENTILKSHFVKH
ncbi:MAG: hypothetical protein HOO06_08325 [Bdellovibrionaceae bacterium]|jgi:hypothetical protein|nr:hypothetical protein [Pseudobdellovibrionaceae bacterium]